MKKTLLPLLLLLAFVFVFTDNASANVYASGIKISDDSVATYGNASNSWDENFSNGGVKIWFIINEDGVGTLAATVTIKQANNVVRTLDVSSPVKGVNSVIWDGYDNSSNPASLGSYSFEVNVSDPVGHTSFDSVWVAGAYYQGSDFDGGSSFAYRGNASNTDQSSSNFGNIYVSRGTSSANGFYEIRADGNYLRKIGTNPAWPSSTPNELQSVGDNIYGLAGYGYTNAGFVRGFNASTDTEVGTGQFGTASVRGFAIKVVGNDTIYYTGRSGSGLNPAIITKTGINGDTATFINMRPYIAGNGYIKAIVVDDAGNVFVAFGEASASRKKIAVFSNTGTYVNMDSTDGSFGLSSSAIISSMVLISGDPNTETDDSIYVIVASGTAGEAGIYQLCNQLCFLTPVVKPVGISTAATSEMLGMDPAGNVVWSNGSTKERIIVFSPADGSNAFTTVNPIGTDIVVNTVVPVELVSFSALLVENKVQLKWSTATETNNKGFEVEKRINNEWNRIGYVSGSGTSTEKRTYIFTDEQINVSGKVYYRLKQIDFDGSFTYSAEAAVDVNLAKDFVLEQNYPNPFNPSTTIKYNIPIDANVTLELFNIKGELVKTVIREYKSAGNYEIKFNASLLASGTYIYRLTAGNIVLTKKMLLMK